MHLAQHHFQAQGRYFEESTSFALASLFVCPYGLAGIELDSEALRNGTVGLTHARGVMPDGLPFHFPESDPPPPALDIRERFEPTHDSHLVHLVIPPYRPGRGNLAAGFAASGGEGSGGAMSQGPSQNGGVRYGVRTRRIADETTGADEKPVELGLKNFHLALDNELSADAISLPVARVRRSGSGHFVYDPDFIPPVLQIGASPRLMLLLQRLVEMLDEKSASLVAERNPSAANLAEYGSREVAGFWLAHAIHSALAPLRHHFRSRRSHPEQVYGELARLAGALCTFSMTAHPRSIPLYDHDDPTACFGELEAFIRTNLGVVLPTGAVRVPLAPTSEYVQKGAVADRRCLENAHWFLGIRSSRPAAELAGEVPRLVKVCSGRWIEKLVERAFPGLPLEHVTSPPSAITPRIGSQYFRVTTDDKCWQDIVASAEVGIYVPGAIPDADLELVVVIEEKPA